LRPCEPEDFVAELLQQVAEHHKHDLSVPGAGERYGRVSVEPPYPDRGVYGRLSPKGIAYRLPNPNVSG
jgi:hypothetical protein